MTKVIVVFLNFANAPKKHKINLKIKFVPLSKHYLSTKNQPVNGAYGCVLTVPGNTIINSDQNVESFSVKPGFIYSCPMGFKGITICHAL